MRPSFIARCLLSLIRGPKSEYLKGDLDEWLTEEAERRARHEQPRSFEVEVARSVIEWWKPRSFAGRLRSRRMSGSAGLLQECRYALRSLWRRPAYAILAVGVMGLGIGATTTVLTVVDRVLVRTLPFPQAERLAVIGSTFPDREWREDVAGLQHLAGFSLANFLDWEQRSRAFEQLAGIEQMVVLLPDRGAGPELVQTAAVTPNFFDILQVRPALGRTFLPHEYSTGSPDVVVLSHAAWVTRYGADPSAVGQTLGSLEGGTTIIGVLPEDFEVPEALATEVNPFWFPINLDSDRYASRGRRGLSGLGVLRPEATIETARADLAAIAGDLADEFPDGNVYPDGRRLGAGANALQAHTIGATGRPIVLFAGAALLLLLMSGLNTANLTLVRGMTRDREIGVRRALGASRGSLVRLFVMETGMLAVGGGVLGLAMAQVGIAAFRRLGPTSIPRMAEIGLDGRIALYATLITLGAGVATGLIPALRLTRQTDRGTHGGSGTRTTSGSSIWRWTVGVQVALSMLLMVSAGLLMESFIRLRSFEPGFSPESALTFQQGLKRPGTEGLATHQLWDEMLEQVDALSGYHDVAAGSNLPYQAPNWAPWVLLPDDDTDSHRTGIAGYVVTPNYFSALRIPILEGRSLERTDGPDGLPVAVVNEAFVSNHMSGRSPIGTTLRLRQEDSLREVRVVGVVGNTVQGRAQEGLLPALYVPHTQTDWPSAWVFARAVGDPLSGVDAVRTSIAKINPYVPPRFVATMESRITATRTEPRFNASLAMAFGLVSLILSAGGLYGALSFGVRRRLHEIGVRMALGATRLSVLRLVLAQGLGITAVGAAIGLIVAQLGGGLIRAFLFEVQPTSLAAIVTVTASLLVVATLASLGPALRATRVDPVRSLSAD